MLPEWSKTLDEALSANRGLATKIAERIGKAPPYMTELRQGRIKSSPHVPLVSDLAGIPRPLVNISDPTLRELLVELEGLDDEAIETLIIIAKRLRAKKE